MKLPLKFFVLLGLVALPVGTLMLAKLFDSAVLGWMFGLMLAFGMALVPLVVVACAAYRLIRWTVRRGRARVTLPAPGSMCAVRIERGSVHASDDAPSRQLTVSAASTMRTVIADALADGYLPRVSGNRATWVIEASGAVGAEGARLQPLAVWSQAWPEPAFVIDPDRPATSLAVDGSLQLRCNYRGVEDPGDVFDALVARAAVST
jgi:hypothetical protein